MREHMLLISGEQKWNGYMWLLRLSGGMCWLRSTTPAFPLVGLGRYAMLQYSTPRPHRRDELLVYGGVLDSQALWSWE